MTTARHRAFRLEIEADFTLPGLRELSSAAGPPDLRISLTKRSGIESEWSGSDGEPVWSTRFTDGQGFTVERGRVGDHRFGYGKEAIFHLDHDAERLLCAADRPEDSAWQRVLLDTVLFSTSLIRGNAALHGSAVSTAAGALAFVSVSGGGKTTLAGELIRRGHPLVADDVLVIERAGSETLVHPGPPVMNLPRALSVGAPALGRTLARFDAEGEDWMEVERAVSEPVPLAALFMFERREGLTAAVSPLAATALDLLPYTIFYRHLGDRQRQRFELMSDIVNTVRVFRLTGDGHTAPTELASLVEGCINSPLVGRE